MLVGSVISSLLSTAVMLGVALWVLFKIPKSPASRLFLLVVFSLILILVGFFLISAFNSLTQINWGYHLLAFGFSFSPLVWIWFSLAFARESHEVALRRWKYALLVSLALGVVFLFFFFGKKLILLDKDIFGSINFHFSPSGILLLMFLLLSSVVAIINLESTFRYSQGSLRRALFAPMLFLALFLFMIIFSTSRAMLSAQIGTYPFFLAALISIPMSILVGRHIVKFDLSASTVYIGRQVAYSSIVLILIGTYLFFIGIVAKIVQIVGGNLNVFYSVLGAFLLIIIFSVLVVSSSVKQRIKSFVDKTFYRGKFDYQKEWSGLSEEISTVLDLDDLFSKVVASLWRSLEIKKVHLFVMQKDGTFSLSYPKEEGAKVEIEKGGQLLEWIWLYAKPIKIEDIKQGFGALGSSFSKDSYLDDTEAEVCVPLITKRELVGLLFLGEKKDRDAYTSEELDLLEAMAHQLAIAILNAKMSEELLISKEMESFHKFSSFVVHDLKNSISMLSMLLQNAKDNMQDRNFQKSAMLTISDAIERMRGLVTKISSPEKMKLDLVEYDLAQVVRDVLQDIHPLNFPKTEFNLNLNQTPKVVIDKSQMAKVLQNLVINAIESMPQGGKIDIDIRAEDPFLLLAVSDSGVGMSKEFMRNRLFKPFCTTKSKGLGIGLYQSKEIVEAHNGKIEVESIEDKGTTFLVKLPIVK